MSITRLSLWLAAVVAGLVEQVKRASDRQKQYAGKYGRMVDTMTKEIIGNFREFVKN